MTPPVLTCLICGCEVWASLTETWCACGTVRSFGGRMWVSYRKPNLIAVSVTA